MTDEQEFKKLYDEIRERYVAATEAADVTSLEGLERDCMKLEDAEIEAHQGWGPESLAFGALAIAIRREIDYWGER